MRNPFLLSWVLLFSAVAALNAQNMGQKKVYIYIDEAGKKVDTTIVWNPMDQAKVDEMIARFMNDSLGPMDFHNADIFDNRLPSPRAFFFSEDDFPGKKRMIWAHPMENDSVAFSYYFNDSAGFHSPGGNRFFHWTGDSLMDSLFAENFPIGSNKMEIEKFLQDHGRGKRMRVIVENPDADQPRIMEGDGEKVSVWNDRPREKKSTIEWKDIPEKNELVLTDLRVSGINEDGRWMLRFKTGLSGNLELRITDQKKKEVFSQELKYFDGNFKQEIQLNPDAKGTYYLTIRQGKKKTIKELVVR